MILTAFLAILALAGTALAADEPNVDLPQLQPNDGALQAYCAENYPGTEGIVFSTGSATTNSQGQLMKTEAGFTLTWLEDVGGPEEYDIRIDSITEQNQTELLQFSIVIAFLGGNDENGYEFAPPETEAELIVPGSTGQNITHFGFCAITTGEIIVQKITNPSGSAQLFDFDASWDNDGFSLADGGEELSGRIEDGIYSVSENVPAGWDLTSATCSDGSDPGAIDLSVGETVTCTFVNEEDANIIVEKQTDPDGDPALFTFSTDYSGDFQLADNGTNDSGDLDPGTYSVSENVPTGWDLTSATCTDGSDPGSIDLQAGETVTCTFNNQKDANIIVEKQTDPDGDPALFTFVTNYSAGLGFELADDESNDSGDLDPGTYGVAEVVPPGWDLTSATCSDGSDPGLIDLQAGETVICTFNNQKDAGIIVEKQTDPEGDPALFTFETSYSADFELADNGTNASGDLDPGTYGVAEVVPAGWDLTSATCSDGSDPSAIGLSAGETVTCIFNNQKDANIIVEKQTDPDGDPALFTFTSDYSADFQLSDNGTNDSGDLDPGTYSVSENVPTGWDLTSATCSDGSDPGAIGLSAGETVTCTFNNQKDANIIVEKLTVPAGSATNFTFSEDWDGTGFVLTDGQQEDSGDLDPGIYSVAEVVPAGWDLTSATCSDGSDPAAIDLSAGETVTCTFVNTERGMVELTKLLNGIEDGSIQWTFTLDGPEVAESASVPPNPTDFGGAKLIPGETYTLCERGVPVGYSNVWTLDGVAQIPYDPAAGDPDASNEDYCVDFTVEPGQTVEFIVDNIPPPGGDQRTPGYWKNWNTCSPGNQATTAANNGGVANGFYLLDDVLPITLGDLVVDACQDGRDLLDRRDLDSGKKRASDAAYNLASHLLAAKANVAAQAGTCADATLAIAEADALLSAIEFDGSGKYLRPRDAEYEPALALAAILDSYNNGELC